MKCKVLIYIWCLNLSFFVFRSNDDETALECFERDAFAVDTKEIFENQCEDTHGNKYGEHSETSSCCECLM